MYVCMYVYIYTNILKFHFLKTTLLCIGQYDKYLSH